MFANYCIFVHLASAIAVHCTNLTYPSSLSNILDTAEEVDLSQDLQQWEALSESEKHFISHVLASFAASDGIVLEKLAARFLNDVQIQEVALGYDKKYNVENPFDWMEFISLQGKANFFERRVGDYQKASVMSSLQDNGKNFEFKLDEDF
ncbi:ribonucleoside-diphosphate reductase small chain A-like [Nicotiana tabacum]|uniref:Ribonucleoside-diphosphate reductase small chain A-like n=1 Tax=Nicotiana tabacum TaxID=4097 RepID=A0AC58SKX1_TOBAC